MSDKFDQIELKALRGDTETYIFSITQSGAGFDLSSYSVQATGRNFADCSETLFNLGITSTQDGSDFATGKVVFVLPKDVTQSLPAQVAYDLQATQGSAVTTLARGIIATYKDLTR